MDSDSTNQPSNTKPDVNDPNNYCRVCDKTYTRKTYFKYHVRAAHSIGKKDQETEETKPDTNDPNNYCRVCQRTYASKQIYRRHLRTVQLRMIPTAFLILLIPTGTAAFARYTIKTSQDIGYTAKRFIV
ncbi:hypothetical protein MBANPS3_012602 [Mucor bainieri]